MSSSIGPIVIVYPRRRPEAWAGRRAQRRRRKLAQGYGQVLDDVRRPARAYTARIPVEPAQVLAAARDIERLVALLRDRGCPARDEGVRLALRLLCDGASPLFLPCEPGTLRRHVRLICEAME